MMPQATAALLAWSGDAGTFIPEKMVPHSSLKAPMQQPAKATGGLLLRHCIAGGQQGPCNPPGCWRAPTR